MDNLKTNPTPVPGQRWSWKLNDYKHSETVIEITRVDSLYAYYTYVQIIVKGYAEDIIGNSGYNSLSYFTSDDHVTYLPGQDKVQNG